MPADTATKIPYNPPMKPQNAATPALDALFADTEHETPGRTLLAHTLTDAD